MSDVNLIPSFLIHFNGSRLPVEREADVQEIIVCDRVDAPSSFLIKVADPENVWLEKKEYYVDAEVKIQLGYKDALTKVITGEVTGVTTHYKTNEPRQVIIKGYNLLHRLNRYRTIYAFNKKTDKEIIEDIAKAAGMAAETENLAHKHPFTLRSATTGYDYLLELADRYDCFFRVWDKKLYFKRLEHNASEDVVLEYGKTLKEIFPVTESFEQITEVAVHGQKISNCESINAKAAYGDIDAQGGKDVNSAWGTTKQVVVDPLVQDQKAAGRLALDTLARLSRSYVTGNGLCEGNPAVLAATVLQLKGLGKRYSGKYFVTEAKHSLKAGKAFVTEFAFISTVSVPDSSGQNSVLAKSRAKENQADGQNQQGGNEQTANQSTASSAAPGNNASITFLKWLKNGKEQTAINIGEEVTLSAKVQGLDDGTWVQIRIYHAGYKDEKNPLFSLQARVEQGKAEYAWIVEYKPAPPETEEGNSEKNNPEGDSGAESKSEANKSEANKSEANNADEDNADEDNADEDNAEEDTLTKYVFMMDVSQPQTVKSANSAELKLYQWIEFEMEDKDGSPYKNGKYQVKDAGGAVLKEGTLDDKGYAKVTDLEKSKVSVVFPDLK